MSTRDPSDKAPAPPSTAPASSGTDDARTGCGAQTALEAMLKKRRMRALRDSDSIAPGEDAKDDAHD
jgi:hypothetical protein